MSDLRSSKQQLKDEMDALYRSLTDPDEISKEQLRKEREKRINDQRLDYGL